MPLIYCFTQSQIKSYEYLSTELISSVKLEWPNALETGRSILTFPTKLNAVESCALKKQSESRAYNIVNIVLIISDSVQPTTEKIQLVASLIHENVEHFQVQSKIKYKTH